MLGNPSARKVIAVSAVLLALVTACSRGDAAQTAVTNSSQAAPAPVAPPPAPALPPIATPEYDFSTVSKLINDAIAANELPGAVALIGRMASASSQGNRGWMDRPRPRSR